MKERRKDSKHAGRLTVCCFDLLDETLTRRLPVATSTQGLIEELFQIIKPCLTIGTGEYDVGK